MGAEAEIAVSVGGLAFTREAPDARAREAFERLKASREQPFSFPDHDADTFVISRADLREAHALASPHSNPGTTGRVSTYRFGG